MKFTMFKTINETKLRKIKVDYSRNSPEFVSGHVLAGSSVGEFGAEGGHARRDLLLRQPAQPHQRNTHYNNQTTTRACGIHMLHTPVLPKSSL